MHFGDGNVLKKFPSQKVAQRGSRTGNPPYQKPKNMRSLYGPHVSAYYHIPITCYNTYKFTPIIRLNYRRRSSAYKRWSEWVFIPRRAPVNYMAFILYKPYHHTPTQPNKNAAMRMLLFILKHHNVVVVHFPMRKHNHPHSNGIYFRFGHTRGSGLCPCTIHETRRTRGENACRMLTCAFRNICARGAVVDKCTRASPHANRQPPTPVQNQCMRTERTSITRMCRTFSHIPEFTLG